MGLSKTITVMPFASGLSQKTDPLAPQVSVAVMENCEFNVIGRVKKRDGYAKLSAQLSDGVGEIDNGQALMAYGDELVLANGQQLYSYNEASGNWVDKGAFVSVEVTQKPVIRDTNTESVQDGVTLTTGAIGLQAYVWEDSSGGCKYTIIDGNTGQPVVAATQLGTTTTAIKPKVQAFGAVFVFFWYDTATHLLYIASLSGASPQATVTGVALTNAIGGTTSVNQTYPNYDVTVGSATAVGGQRMYLGYYSAAGTTTLRYFKLTAPTTPVGVPTFAAVASRCLNLFFDLGAPGGSLVFVYYNGAGNVSFIAYDTALSSVYGSGGIANPGTAVISITGVSVSDTATDLRIFVTTVGSPTSLTAGYSVFLSSITSSFELSGSGYTTLTFGSSGYSVATAVTLFKQVAIASKAFSYGGLAYVPLVFQSHPAGTVSAITYTDPAQTTYFLVDDEATIVSRFFYGTAGNIPTRDSTLNPDCDNLGVDTLAEATALGGGEFRSALLQTNTIDRRVVDGDGSPVASTTTLDNPTPQIVITSNTGVSAVQFALADVTDSYQRATLADTLHIGGGFLWAYDGLAPVEHGFHLYPDYCSVTLSSGGNYLAGSHSFCVVYSWVDQRGNTQYSAPSVPFTVTATANQKGTVLFPYLSMTAKQGTRSNVMVEIYRTTIDPTSLAVGSIFYKVGEAENVPTTVTGSFIDTSTEAAALQGVQLYTTGGVVENTEPDPVGSITTHRNRLFTVSSTNPLTVFYSKIAKPGLPAEFNFDSFYLSIDPEGGNVSAVASMDDKLIVFKSDRVLMVTGQGPDDTGAQDDFSDSVLVTTDCGCINPRSIVSTPDGLMFQSRKGIYLLSRGLQAIYIGAPVQNYNSMTVTSAQLIRDKNQVRFTMRADDVTPSGIAIIYDYYARQFATFTNINASDSAIWHGTFTYLRPSGLTYTETPGLYSDAGRWIRMLVTTSWIQFAGMQGFQRIYRFLILGQYFSPHKLQIRIATNYDGTSIKQTETITPETFTTWGSDSVWGGNPSIPTDSAVWGGVSPVYQFRVFVNDAIAKGESIQITMSDAPDGTDRGAGASWSCLALYWGKKRSPFQLPAGKSYG